MVDNINEDIEDSQTFHFINSSAKQKLDRTVFRCGICDQKGHPDQLCPKVRFRVSEFMVIQKFLQKRKKDKSF
jgi:hypothetical protein